MIRCKDAGTPCVLLVTGYNRDLLSRIVDAELSAAKFAQHGAAMAPQRDDYRLDLLQSEAE